MNYRKQQHSSVKEGQREEKSDLFCASNSFPRWNLVYLGISAQGRPSCAELAEWLYPTR
jgi:hypothetical protein